MKRRIEIVNDGDGYTRKFYVVDNGDTIGTYCVMLRPDGRAYGAGRDYHRIVSDDETIEFYTPHACEWHQGKTAICDGSSLVEVTMDDERAFAIAEMMAERS